MAPAAPASEIQIVAAFDMSDPAQVAVLNAAWQFSPVEVAQHRVSAAYREVEDFARRNIGSAFLLTRTIPADMEPAKAEALAALMAEEAAARVALAELKSAQPVAAVKKAA